MKAQYKAGLSILIVLALSTLVTVNSYSKVGPGRNDSGRNSRTKEAVQAPATCSGDITLTSQAEVDAFATTYACAVITGTLTISGNDITNLDSLRSLTRVEHDLIISNNPNLIDLTGLSSLSYVGAGGAGPYPGAHITYNPKLPNLDGLNKLAFIAGMLEISNNDTLTNVDGLSLLASIGAPFPSYQSLIITNNPALTSLRGLRSITSLRGIFRIVNNASLPNLDGLESLARIASVQGENTFLAITGNASLTNIDGLSALAEVSGRYTGVTISSNPSLLNLNGLSSLKQINGNPASLEISSNTSLTNVDRLSSLKINGASTYLTVTNNPQLVSCCGLYNTLNVLNSPNCYCNSHISISGNGAGCTKDDILAAGPCPVVCSGNITLSSQAQIDAFPAARGCTEITGTLTISGNDITNLDSLYFLKKIDGDLQISNNPNLTSMKGLSSLTYVGAGGGGPYPGLHITYNPKLPDLDGLNKLAFIAGMLEISNNDTLTNVDGLSLLASIGAPFPSYQSLIITNNPALTSLSGLRSITSLRGILRIVNNASLPNLDGLESLTRIASAQGENTFLAITGNASLTNIDGLSALAEVSGRYTGVTISSNPSLL